MENLEVTSLSSRGQVVIPQGVRDRLHLHSGEKFVVIGEDDTIILKKLEVPSFKGFDKLLKKTRDFAKKKGLKPSDVDEAIKRVRAK
ncbi:MAG: AbrB/MazE/SpoVT family DNA-binding domain-containing protein [Candidatus Nanoarchaeia archaeon]|jgi:antitoxin PrlF|nr:AbrB/MazE/SpoVT family DNA-binding domain-containing protein [Candidatus Nanoarchaeia archaeon]|tara:strand:- start:612 stop:872 length:261 start_codon:yes stop_codon:yes gene_type:complete